MKNHVSIYLSDDELDHFRKRALSRRITLARYMRECLIEHHKRDQDSESIRQEPSAPPFDWLMRETERRVLESITRTGQQGTERLSSEIEALKIMIDRFFLALIAHVPEVPEARHEEATKSAFRRLNLWRSAVIELIEELGLPAPRDWNGAVDTISRKASNGHRA
jgi:hypothetical protein